MVSINAIYINIAQVPNFRTFWHIKYDTLLILDICFALLSPNVCNHATTLYVCVCSACEENPTHQNQTKANAKAVPYTSNSQFLIDSLNKEILPKQRSARYFSLDRISKHQANPIAQKTELLQQQEWLLIAEIDFPRTPINHRIKVTPARARLDWNPICKVKNSTKQRKTPCFDSKTLCSQ